MGFLTWLFGSERAGAHPQTLEGHVETSEGSSSPAQASPGITEEARVPVLEGFFQDATGMFGPCAKSPNGKYTLIWKDANESGTRGGFRTSGKGAYHLLEGDRLLVEGKMARPNEGRVADDGSFILNDWGFGEGLKGTFCAFKASGELIVHKRFKANLFNNGLAPDGTLAVCQTCGAPDSPDDSVLAVFDLGEGRMTHKWRAGTGWADYYDFREPGVIRLGYKGLGGFRYALDGTFLDAGVFEDAVLDRGKASTIMLLVEDKLKGSGGPDTVNVEVVRKLLRGTERAVLEMRELHGKGMDNGNLAWALKVHGKCLDLLGDLAGALAAFEEALQLNPKIGVKQRAGQIRKRIAAT